MWKQLEIELETQRRISRSRGLSVFHRNATTWELFLLLAMNDGQSDLGVYNTIEQLRTGYLGQSALLKFLRDRRSDGLLSFDEHDVRSKWRLRADPAVHKELLELLSSRNRQLAAAMLEPAAPQPGSCAPMLAADSEPASEAAHLRAGKR